MKLWGEKMTGGQKALKDLILKVEQTGKDEATHI